MATTYRDYLSRKKYGEYKKRRQMERDIGIDTYDADFEGFVNSVGEGGSAYQSAEGFDSARANAAALLKRTEALKAYVERYGGDANSIATNIGWLTGQKQDLDSYTDWAQYEKLHNYDFDAAAAQLADLNKQLEDAPSGFRGFMQDVGTTLGNMVELQEGGEQKETNADRRAAIEQRIEALKKEMGRARVISAEGVEGIPFFYADSLARSTNPYKDGEYTFNDIWNNPDIDWRHEYINGFFDGNQAVWDEGLSKTENVARMEALGYMSDTERSRYNYYYNTQGREVAGQYLDGILDTLVQRMAQDGAAYAADHPVLGTLGALGGAFLGTVEELDHLANGTTGNINIFTHMGDNMRAGVADSIDSDVGRFFYNTGVSGVESLIAGTLLGPAGGAVLGLSAMASTRNDLLQRGADAKTATKAGLAAGIFEGLFEAVSLGQLGALKEVPVHTLKDLALNFAKSAGVNASEEMATEVANVLYDTLANGDFSNAQMMLQQYTSQGMSESEAKQQIAKEFGLQIAEAGASGAVMGLGFGALGSGASGVSNAVNASRIGKALKAGEGSFGSVSELAKFGEKYGIKQTARVKEKGAKASNRAVGDLSRRVYSAIMKENEATIAKAVEKRLADLGAEKTKAGELADVVLKKYLRKSLSFKESSLLDRSKIARQTLNEMLEDANSKWINDLKATLKGEASRDISTIGDKEVAEAAKQAAEIARSEGREVQVAASGEKLGSLPQIAALGVDGVTLTAPSGEVALGDVAMTEDKAMLYSLAGLLPSADIANAFVENWNGATDPDAYFRAFQMIYTYGRNHTGYSDAEIAEAGRKSGLSEAQIAAAFKSGVRSLAEERRIERERLDGIVQKFRESGANRPEGKWDAKGLRGVDLKRVAKENTGLRDIEQFVAFLRMATKAFGWNVRVIADNSEGHSNGGYNPATNTLTFNIYSGTMIGTELVRTAMPCTISHETLHWMKENASEQYQALEDMVLAALKNSNDYDFGEAVKKEYGKYKEKHGQDIDDPTAREEIVARACEDLFGRSEAIKQFLADFAEKNKEAATGFTAAVKKVLAKIKAFFENLMSGHGSRTLEAGIVRKCGAEVVDGLQEQYEKTFFAALEGNAARNALGEFEQGGERFSEESDSKTTKGVIKPNESVTENAKNVGDSNESVGDILSYQQFSATDYYTNGLVYSYDFLVSQKDMQSIDLPELSEIRNANQKIDKAKVVSKGLANAASVGYAQDGKIYVKNAYTGRSYRVDAQSIRHGLNGEQNRLLTNSRLGAVIGDVVKNSIPINGLKNTNNAAVGTYALAGYSIDSKGREFVSIVTVEQHSGDVTGLAVYDVTHSLSGRQKNNRGNRFGTKPQGVNPNTNTSVTISITDFLQIVNSTHQSILSDDVLNHLGEMRNSGGYYSNRVLFSDPEDDVKSDREILASLLMGAAANPVERDALAEYQKRARRLDKLNARLHEVEGDIKDMMFARGKRDDSYRERLDALQREKERISRDIDRWDRKLLTLELTTSLQELLDREKKRTAKLWIEAGRNAIGNYREKQLCRIYSEKIEEKAKNLGKMLLENSEKYHIPDAFKKPVAAFLSLLDFSSQRALQGGELTRKNMELQAAFAEVEALLQSLTDENSDEYLAGLDLPPDAVDEFVALSKEVTQMAIESSENGTMVLRRMSSEQLKALNTTLYAMTRAVGQANKLFVNERYQHVSELALDFIDSSEQYAARAQRSKLSDFLSFENMVPYYAFKRFGAAGEALFKGFMQGQDKFAFLVKEIIDFTDKLYTEDEVKEWSRQVHTFEGTNGKVYITTAQIMSLYELWKDADARKHILGGGGRIQDISFGAKKKYTNDPNGTAMGDLLVDAMFARLTPRQKAVADSLQKFMAEECAKWGNEVSYKRWGIRMFGLDYYFPIESDKNTLKADVEQRAKETGLFSLLHKSFTKKRVFNANNRIMIRSVFDVFASHATDMAKYNAFALPLLDMQKFINFKEIVTKEQAAAEAYESAEVNEDILQLVGKVKKGQHKDNDFVDLGVVAGDVAQKIKPITGQDFTGYKIAIEARQIEHIIIDHGENGQSDHSMADDNDIAKMLYAIASPDNVSDGGTTRAYFHMVNGKNRPAKTALYERSVGDKSYYVVQTAVDTKKKTLHIVSAFIGKSGYKRGAPQLTSAQGLGATSKNAIAGTPTNSIAQPSDIVKMGISPDGEQKDTSFTTKEVRTSMEKAFGTAAYKYIEQFLIDLNGDIGGRSAAEGILQKGITAHKIAAVGANLRVALLQPTAYVRLLNVMEPKYFFGGLGVAGRLKACIEKMQRYSGIALWKSLGYRDANVATPLQTKIKHDETWRDKAVEKSMILAELGDKVTWGMIWHACELETRDKHAELKVGGEEYYRTVAERFTEVIYQTQVVDSTFTKSQIMRKKDFFSTLFTAFMSEPTLSYNLLASNALSLLDTKRRGGKITWVGAKPFVRAVGVFALSALTQALVASLVDAARDDGEDEEYWQKYGNEFLSNILQEIVPFNLVPILKDIWSIALATMRGDYYNSSRMDLEIYNRIAKATKAIGKMFENGEVTYSAIHKILSALSSASGLPISNLLRDVVAIWNTIVGSFSKGLIVN